VPAAALEEGWVMIASFDALAGLTLIALEVAVREPAVNVKVTPPVALVTNKPLNVATPPDVVAVWAAVVAFKNPPVVSVAVTMVPLGVLPN
jgi:hypothetical protein